MITYCNQNRHRSVGSGFLLREILLEAGHAVVVNTVDAEESWPKMQGRCRGQCAMCSHTVGSCKAERFAISWQRSRTTSSLLCRPLSPRRMQFCRWTSLEDSLIAELRARVARLESEAAPLERSWRKGSALATRGNPSSKVPATCSSMWLPRASKHPRRPRPCRQPAWRDGRGGHTEPP